MPQFEFSYLAQPFKDSSGKLADEFRPFVPIILSKGRKATPPVYALVDSGADFNLFPAHAATILGIDLKKGGKKEIYGVGDGKVIAYKHRVKIHIAKYSFDTEVYFSERQKLSLLGRTGFFNLFDRINFNQKKKSVLFRM
jgi:predicted aspartyl protease